MKFKIKAIVSQKDKSKKRERLYYYHMRSRAKRLYPNDHEIKSKKKTINYRKTSKKLASWAFTIFLSFAIAILVNIYVLRPSQVLGESMLPTLKDADIVYISRLPYMFGPVEAGDIVVINSNKEAKKDFFSLVVETLKSNLITRDFFSDEVDIFWVKRVIGVSGDIIEFKNDTIYRNGEKLDETYLNKQEDLIYPNGTKITVKEGYIYVMGDNRGVSRDSRQEGQIPIESLVGKLVFRK